jgi:hypothetical protein
MDSLSISSLCVGRLAVLLGLVFISTWLLPSQVEALGMGPLTLEKPTGELDVSNNSDRLIKIEIQVFTPRKVKGLSTAGGTAIPAERAESIIRLRPQHFRLGPKSGRRIRYRILDTHNPFYICAVSPSGLLIVRVCSRWPGL